MVLEGEEPVRTIRALIRQVTLSLGAVPIFCGSAFKNKGVKLLLDAVTRYLPSPADVPPVRGLKIKSKVVTEEEVDAYQVMMSRFRPSLLDNDRCLCRAVDLHKGVLGT